MTPVGSQDQISFTKDTKVPINMRKAFTSNEDSGLKAHFKLRRSSEPANPSRSDSIQNSLKHRAEHLLFMYGELPLQGLVGDNETPSNVTMAHLIHALLASAPISHQIAMRTLTHLIDEQYNDLEVLHAKSSEEISGVLTKGGYTKYLEKTTTYLEDLAKTIKEYYGDDASKIFPRNMDSSFSLDMLSDRLKDIKGLGPVGIDIFLGSIQYFYPQVAPFLDKRSKATAQKLGLGDDVEPIYAAIGSDPLKMARMEAALTRVRLEQMENP